MRWPREDAKQVEVLLAVGLITLVIGFAILTQFPPSAFNYHDDFQKYLAHPVRMLATGTLFGSPLSAIGSETLGGLAFLHAFPLLVAPVEYINGVDAILGLLLLMMLGASAGWGRAGALAGRGTGSPAHRVHQSAIRERVGAVYRRRAHGCGGLAAGG